MIPVHKGAKEYFDGEEQTFMERYSDWLYTGLIILGALYSALLAIWRLLRPAPLEAPLLATVPEISYSIKNATSLDELDAINARVDAAIERISVEALNGKLEDSKVVANTLVIGYLSRLVRERRAELQNKSGA